MEGPTFLKCSKLIYMVIELLLCIMKIYNQLCPSGYRSSWLWIVCNGVRMKFDIFKSPEIIKGFIMEGSFDKEGEWFRTCGNAFVELCLLNYFFINNLFPTLSYPVGFLLLFPRIPRKSRLRNKVTSLLLNWLFSCS